MAPAIYGIVMVIIAIIGAYVMIIYLRKYANEERMAMIEKGVDPHLFHVKKSRRDTSLAAASGPLADRCGGWAVIWSFSGSIFLHGRGRLFFDVIYMWRYWA